MKLPKPFSLDEIAMLAGGVVKYPDGASKVMISAVATNPLKAGDGDLALVFDQKLIRRLDEIKAQAVIVPEGTDCRIPHIQVKRPLVALARLLSAAQPKKYYPEKGIHPLSCVDPTAEIAEDVAIGPFVVIGPKSKIGRSTKVMANTVIGGEVTIGEHTVIGPGCLIGDYVQIGNRVVLQQGACLGSDGFGYTTERPSNLERRLQGNTEIVDQSNPHIKIPQIGTIIVEDNVEIGSCTTIDRATMGATRIGKGAKIDNQVMIAHNVTIGQEALVIANVSIAGSSTIGDRAVVAGHAAVSDHIHLGKDAIVEGMAGVMNNVQDGEAVSGIPAKPVKEHMRTLVLLRRLPQFNSDIKELKKRIETLEAQLEQAKVSV